MYQGAFLSDTDTTNVTGEKIDLTNGSVPAGNNASVASVTANQLVFSLVVRLLVDMILEQL